MGNFFGGAMGVIFMIASPLTFILGVADTWTSNSSVLAKILISLTLDAFMAFIWPITWVIWIAMHAMGNSTPLSTVLGF